IGDDQKQHLELTRLLAERFNSQYGETFVVPKAYYPKTAARIMDLQDPTKKMSKSEENQKGVIFLLDDIRQTKNKIRGAITDSDTKIKYDKIGKPGISNLLDIYASISDLTIKEIEIKYENSNYQTFKEDLANLIEEIIVPIQERYNEIIKSKRLDEILNEGRNKASFIARRKIYKVYKRVGIKR
ncbi:MAG: tryptophan--tRNA ligase, partial [Acholeplasmataceae bacterium]|nr:tryptophan--tRNA ligase [Acholeplasmataceae bacterium]